MVLKAQDVLTGGTDVFDGGCSRDGFHESDAEVRRPGVLLLREDPARGGIGIEGKCVDLVAAHYKSASRLSQTADSRLKAVGTCRISLHRQVNYTKTGNGRVSGTAAQTKAQGRIHRQPPQSSGLRPFGWLRKDPCQGVFAIRRNDM